MKNDTTKKRYCPHLLETKLHAVEIYRKTKDISFVCRRYHISKASLMRWNRAYDGTRESLQNKSHKPHSPHPNAHTEEELKWIRDYHRRNPNISICELYGKLRKDKAYSRHPGSLYRVFVRLGFRKKSESTKKKSKHIGNYDTHTTIGEKWQMDVKYVPTACHAAKEKVQYFQYTIIEEASRKRFIYAYEEDSSYSTLDFIKRAIIWFGYAPNEIQTDCGGEFTHTAKTKRIHPLDVFCNRFGIRHHVLRPRTPWHNSKVERSHRNDQERFYNHIFYSYRDLQKQMERYLKRSNNIPMAVLGWKCPNQIQKNLGGR